MGGFVLAVLFVTKLWICSCSNLFIPNWGSNGNCCVLDMPQPIFWMEWGTLMHSFSGRSWFTLTTLVLHGVCWMERGRKYFFFWGLPGYRGRPRWSKASVGLQCGNVFFFFFSLIKHVHSWTCFKTCLKRKIIHVADVSIDDVKKSIFVYTHALLGTSVMYTVTRHSRKGDF